MRFSFLRLKENAMVRIKVAFFLMTLAFVMATLAYGQSKVPVVNGKIKRLPPFGAPSSSDIANGDYFYGIYGLACSIDGKLFLSDQQSASVRVFSLESGKELYKFGRLGKGPGEFMQLSGIRFLNDGNLCVIDNMLKRCAIFEASGKLVRMIGLKYYADDLDFIDDDKIIVSSFVFDFSYSPLRIMSISRGSTLEEFGKIVDPRKGLVDLIQKSRARSQREFYSHGWMNHVVVLPNREEIIYSQRHPYTLVKYNLKTKLASTFNIPVDFDTEDKLTVERNGQRESIGYGGDPGRVLRPGLYGSLLLVPIFSADVQTNYLDCYEESGKLKQRYRIPPMEKKLQPLWCSFRGPKELLVLIRNEFGINWVERFSLVLNR